MIPSATFPLAAAAADVPGTAGAAVQTGSDAMRQFLDLFSKEALLSYAGIGVRILIVVLLTLLVRQIVCRMIEKVFRNRVTMTISHKDAREMEEKRLQTLSKLFKSIASYTLYFIAAITCLDMVGFSVTTILAGAGILSLAVAFGAQSVVQDLMSGIFIVLENQYAVGEYVQIDNIQGQVREIGMKTTKVLTADGELMIIANGSIGRVVNYSRAAQRGYVDVGIAYEEDLTRVFAVLEQACAEVSARYADDFEETPHVLGVTDFADSAVMVRLSFTAWHWQQLVIERALRQAVKTALDTAGVEIAYPKVELITPHAGPAGAEPSAPNRKGEEPQCP